MSDDEDNCISPGLPGFPGDIMIDGWMFCPHGLEECHKCCVDHRETNNIQVKTRLYKVLTRLCWHHGDRCITYLPHRWPAGVRLYSTIVSTVSYSCTCQGHCGTSIPESTKA
jgi:hypothetical protein